MNIESFYVISLFGEPWLPSKLFMAQYLIPVTEYLCFVSLGAVLVALFLYKVNYYEMQGKVENQPISDDKSTHLPPLPHRKETTRMLSVSLISTGIILALLAWGKLS